MNEISGPTLAIRLRASKLNRIGAFTVYDDRYTEIVNGSVFVYDNFDETL